MSKCTFTFISFNVNKCIYTDTVDTVGRSIYTYKKKDIERERQVEEISAYLSVT